jgi:hypothetical protein
MHAKMDGIGTNAALKFTTYTDPSAEPISQTRIQKQTRTAPCVPSTTGSCNAFELSTTDRPQVGIGDGDQPGPPGASEMLEQALKVAVVARGLVQMHSEDMAPERVDS